MHKDAIMTKRQLKLGLVPTGVGGPGDSNRWLDTDIPLDASVSIDWYVDIVRQAEQAKFDLVFIVDSQFITPHSPPHYLNRLEPLTLLSALAAVTSRIGLVGTLTTSYNDPFNLARRFASLDLISKGRAGWNVVTSGDAGTAGNFSLPEHFDYDTRYRRAVEFWMSRAASGRHGRRAHSSAIVRRGSSWTPTSSIALTIAVNFSRWRGRSISSAHRRGNR